MGSQTRPNRAAKTRVPASHDLLGLAVDRRPGAAPLYRQLRDGVHAALLSGTLAAGMRLPPEREMAAALGVNRTTVTRAYQELVADGLVEPRGSAGTVVLPPAGATSLPPPEAPPWLLSLPALGEGSLGPDPTLLRDVAASSVVGAGLSLAAGAPGPDLLPVAELSACLGEALDRWGREALGYGAVEGFGPLREIIAARMDPGLVGPGDGVLVVSGATQGLALVARALVERGDDVVVEAPAYPGALQTFALAGARLIGVPVDRDGLRTDLLEAVLARRRVRLIVVQPTFHNPTGAVLSAGRRERLLALARRFGVPILEDDPYHDLRFADDGPGPLKLADRAGAVIYLGTFSKTVMPGLRVGWVVGSQPLLDRLVLAKQFSDLNTNATGQLMVARFLDSGRYPPHLRSVRAVYRRRCDHLRRELAGVAEHLEVPEAPAGGFYLWCRLRAGPQARLLAALAAREGVAVVAGDAFGVGAARGADRVRLSFSTCPPEVVPEAVRRLRAALDQLPGPAAAGQEAAVVV
jgi:DNA-binding transcriptional MocR family regulator